MEELRYMRPAPLQPVSLAAPFYAPPPDQATAPLKKPLVRLLISLAVHCNPHMKSITSKYMCKVQIDQKHEVINQFKKPDYRPQEENILYHPHRPQSCCISLLSEVIGQYRCS